jgi:hypothetical protein
MTTVVKITGRKIALAYIWWWILWALVGAYVLKNTVGLSWRDALLDSVNTSLIIASAGCLIYNVLRYYQPRLQKAFHLFIWNIVLAALCVYIQHYLTTHYPYLHDAAYLTFFSKSFLVRGLFVWLMINLITIVCWIWFYVQEQQDSKTREADAVSLAREAELSKLRQQLQPHFLFNSLNSISALAGTRPEEARKMIQQLSDFLRGTLKKDDQQHVPLAEELHQLQLYLAIEKIRFGHRLNTEISQHGVLDTMVLPPLLLQPIVENAIKFGLYDTIGEITISVTVAAAEKELLIEVKNPFDPETNLSNQGTGFGLNFIQRRLYLLYARNDLLSTRKHENIFITSIKIPQPL